ncbi:hypothetical protein YA0002_11500 [Pseudomonas cichorii]|uniref:hypothetical protein n=1 Tax=Pseudomonas cichorii TaxID=36746 RepID=UPI0018E613C9|nr:hypothetical protein [Pseudomonas cichorii]MBI6853392.1 hypothetical protein [Pseudomonas cichorii]
MNKINEGLRIIADARHALAIDEQGMINAETLVTGERPPSVRTFLGLADTLPLIRPIADRADPPMLAKWFDVAAVSADPEGYMHALRAAGVLHRVPGTPGRRSRQESAVAGVDIDYRPGLWLHSDLILPLARWMGSRQSSPHKTPLVAFLEKHLAPAAPAAPVTQQEVASAFADEVSAADLQMLRKIDQVLMGDGVSAAERREVLGARITVMQGA